MSDVVCVWTVVRARARRSALDLLYYLVVG